MKILLIDSNEPINNRNVKIIDSLNNKENIDIVLVTWNRNNNIEKNYNVSKKYVFDKHSRLGDKVKKTLNLISYYKFLKNVNNLEQPKFIIASHYDMLVLGNLIKRSNQYLIYENLDIPTSYNRLMLSFLRSVEKMALKKTDYIIHASRFYPQLYSYFKNEQNVLENIPKLKTTPQHLYERDKKKIVISFIGGIRYVDILFKLINESVKFSNIEIRFHGEGHESEKLKHYIEINNLGSVIKMGGRYDYESITGLYLESDFIWSVYPNHNFNVKYAISNKFHESLFFGVPGIYANATMLGDLVEQNRIGLTVNPNSTESINALLRSISERQIDVEVIKSNITKFKDVNFSSWDSGINRFVEWMNSKNN